MVTKNIYVVHKHIGLNIFIITLLVLFIIEYLFPSQQFQQNLIISVVSAVVGSLTSLPLAIQSNKQSRLNFIDEKINIINNENKSLNKSTRNFIHMEDQINIFTFDERTPKIDDKYNITDIPELYSICEFYLVDIKNTNNDVVSSIQNICSIFNTLIILSKNENNWINFSEILRIIEKLYSSYKIDVRHLLKNDTLCQFTNNFANGKFNECRNENNDIGFLSGEMLRLIANNLQLMNNKLNDIVNIIIKNNLYKYEI